MSDATNQPPSAGQFLVYRAEDAVKQLPAKPADKDADS
jgi:hypothetical protein